MTKNRFSLSDITNELDTLRNKRAAEIRHRIEQLQALRARIDTELLVLLDEVDNVDIPGTQRRRPRHVIPECGTESGYQRHRRLKEKCDECKAAHANHARIAAARRKLSRMGVA